MKALQSVVQATSYVGGQVLRAVTGAIAARPAAKPLHPRGSVVTGTLHRRGHDVRSGAPWLDDTGVDRVLVRRSRAVGLPGPLPDVLGLALRVPLAGGGHGDLLLASTGLGRLTRFVLTASRAPLGRPMTSLLPYRTPAGPVLVSAVAHDERTLGLAWAVGAGAWHPFAELTLDDATTQQPDAPVSFDPVTHPLPGLEPYDWVRRLREPAYRTARGSRRPA